jgi:hypothetical protein
MHILFQRTKYGLLQDGWNSGIRYYKNNYSDGFRTDGLHFFLGDLTPKDITNGIVSDKVRQTNSYTFDMPFVPTLVFELLCLCLHHHIYFKLNRKIGLSYPLP